MTLPNGPAGLVPNIEFGVGFGDLAGLVNRHQDVVADILKAEVQLSVGWNTATAILWDGLQRGIPFVLALLQGIVQRLTNTVEQFPGVAQALDAIEHVPGVSQLQGLVGSFVNTFDGGATALNAIIFNNDGGAQVTFSPNLTQPLSVIIHHLDGGATGLHDLVFNNDGGAIIRDVATAGTGLISAVDGGAMSLAQAVQSNLAAGVATAQQITGGVESSIHNAFGGFIAGLHDAFTGPTSAPPPTPIQVSQVTAAAAALQQQLVNIGNGAEESVDIEFNAYSNGSLPAIFTNVSGSGLSISGGLLVASVGASEIVVCNVATLTDFQLVKGVWASLGASGSVAIAGRMEPPGVIGAYAQYITGSGQWRMQGGSWAVALADTFTPGAEYALACGMASNPLQFQLLKNGTPLTITANIAGPYSSQVGQTYLNDTGALTTYGPSFRQCGILVGGDSAMFSFGFQDTTQSQPSVWIATTESTASTTYTDLATTSDEVAVNIGPSGKAQVFINAQLGNNTVGALSCVSFAMSGANTQAAADNYSISVPANASDKTRFGAPFLLTDLTPGLTLFKMKYRAGSGTANFTDRRIDVTALT